MPIVYHRTSVGVVPSQRSIRLGVLEASSVPGVVYFLFARWLMLLEGNAACLRGNRQCVGSKVSNLRCVLHNFPPPDLVSPGRKHVHSKNDDVRFPRLYDCLRPIVLEMIKRKPETNYSCGDEK